MQEGTNVEGIAWEGRTVSGTSQRGSTPPCRRNTPRAMKNITRVSLRGSVVKQSQEKTS